MDDWGRMENWDEGTYCPDCDASYYELDTRPLSKWYAYDVCPACGHTYGRVYLNDDYYALGFYLLSVADDDDTWPDFCIKLPMYEA